MIELELKITSQIKNQTLHDVDGHTHYSHIGDRLTKRLFIHLEEDPTCPNKRLATVLCHELGHIAAGHALPNSGLRHYQENQFVGELEAWLWCFAHMPTENIDLSVFDSAILTYAEGLPNIQPVIQAVRRVATAGRIPVRQSSLKKEKREKQKCTR